MSAVQSTHQFADAATARIQGLRSEHCQLHIRQRPEHAKVAVGKEKDRKPVDPPPIIQLTITPQSDPAGNYLQSPYFFMSCNLLAGSDGGLPSGPLGTALAGTLVSSLHRLKDSSNTDGAFFVFGDLSIKLEGTFCLQFNLFEMRDKECFHIRSTKSDPFIVHPHKSFPGMSESTFLTRSFSDQGVRLRLRKEPRTLLKKRGPASDDYQPRTYIPRQNRAQGFSQEQPAAEGQNASRRDLPEHAESTQLAMHSQRQAHQYEPRPSIGRGYSHHSQPSQISIPGSGTYSDDGPNKRPRTGSEHSSNYSQQLSPQDQFPSRAFGDHQFSSSFASPTGGSYNSNFTFMPPGSSGMSSRGLYFSQRLNAQTGNSPSYDTSNQRSPLSAHFPPQHHTPQPNQMRYQQPPIIASSPTHRTHFDNYAMRSQMTPALQQLDMAPPSTLYASRLNSSPTTFSPVAPLQMSRRGFEYPPTIHGGVSASSIDTNLMASRPPQVSTSTAPADLDRQNLEPTF
ncbi:velvet factor-domain-containing protein [Amylocarpus encephaloides]|uniref:Velvet factor-domain-containing protein n=1 Tax=Amylocarpus encephaloides TaxID=45428 RepID=A0A9P7YGQ8_9HELO|nr:velvet factor-domain-containing protein [Amylocarpus encephaloides]